jgi:serine/threonine-protein kinase
VAAALAPAPDARPALPPALRAWLGARNPMLVPYMAWAGGFGKLTLVNLVVWLAGHRPAGPRDIVLLAGITSAPLLPIIGFHLNLARRQFRAGYTLADLRAALEVGRRERVENESLSRDDTEPLSHRALRVATIGAGTWLATTFGLIAAGIIREATTGAVWIAGPVITTLGLAALSNALDVQFVPTKLRAWWQTGIRERLWKSRVGEWLARRLGAPERSRAIGGNAFRATEAALGVAASELFAALPKAYREELADLPVMIAALEARAAEARAEIDVVEALGASGTTDAEVLRARREAASGHLTKSVAALEGIRLDLLRLHAGASDLAPLTTLIQEARVLSEDIERLAEAQREVDDAVARPRPSLDAPSD